VSDLANEDEHADHLLSNVYRWLTSSKNSKLYDPLLHRLVHKLMSLNLRFLLSRFKQLQCKVIYASFHKVYVHVEQRTLHEAETHIQFVLENIQSGDLFRFIRLQPVEYWRSLLFKDRFNFAGIKETAPEEVTMYSDIVQHLPQATRKRYEVIVKEFVAKVSKHNQKLLKQDLEQDAFEKQRELDYQQAQGLLDDGPKAADKKIESVLDTVDDCRKEADHEFVSQLIAQHYSQRLFQVVSDLIENKTLEQEDDEDGYGAANAADGDGYRSDYGEEMADEDGMYKDQLEVYWEEEDDFGGAPGAKAGAKGKARKAVEQRNAHVEARKRREREKAMRERRRWEFPEKIGSHHTYVSPALEFSKFMSTHVFGLDDAFHLEAQKIKSNLLRMIHCKEFSSEAQGGLEPSLILVVPDVICDHCCNCFDLDICRDPSLLASEGDNLQNEPEGIDQRGGEWLCSNPDCEQALNKNDIERRLIDLVNRRLVQYQMQDLVCLQCKMVKNSVVSKYCDCTGCYKQTIGHALPEKLQNQNLLNNVIDIQLFMQLIRNFANYHSLTILRDTAEQILQII